MHSVADFERAARARLPRIVYEFVTGGAEDEITLRRNRSDFECFTFQPHVLVPVERIDTSVRLFDRTYPSPLGLGPAGLVGLVHSGGEVDVARGAAAAGQLFVLSTGSSRSLEEVADVGPGPRWFQLYMWRDRSVIAELVRRAAAAGYEALCVTVDVPVVGNRERDVRNGMAIPPRIRPANALNVARHPRWVRDVLLGSTVTYANLVRGDQGVESTNRIRRLSELLGLSTNVNAITSLADYVNRELNNPGSDWDDIAWIRSLWDGPLLIKGILRPDDAIRAKQLGADGVVVSNHGGRQLDGASAAISALPAIVDAVGDGVAVILDGGVRRGADIAKALALGARMTFTARPYICALAVSGAAGVEALCEIYRRELRDVLALLGCDSAESLNRDLLEHVSVGRAEHLEGQRT